MLHTVIDTLFVTILHLMTHYKPAFVMFAIIMSPRYSLVQIMLMFTDRSLLQCVRCTVQHSPPERFGLCIHFTLAILQHMTLMRNSMLPYEGSDQTPGMRYAEFM